MLNVAELAGLRMLVAKYQPHFDELAPYLRAIHDWTPTLSIDNGRICVDLSPSVPPSFHTSESSLSEELAQLRAYVEEREDLIRELSSTPLPPLPEIVH